MSTFLFAWNPVKWDWTHQSEMISQLSYQRPIQKWATNRIKLIGKGHNFILIKIGNIQKTEKGIIGFGTIQSEPYTGLDFVLDPSKTRNFVDLEFDYLSNKPLLLLEELEEKFPTIHWTPEGNGNLIKQDVAKSIFEKISNTKQNFKKNILFEKHIYFPIIAEIIDLKLTQQISVHRDEIVHFLHTNHKETLNKIAAYSNKTTLFIAQNMVDWFSAELTKKSGIVSEWQDKYIRNKIKVNGREITSFSLILTNNQDENIPENIQYKEGSIKQITVNAYERNPHARKKCLEYFGYSCQCCNFNFEQQYGELGREFIHVHHITPLSYLKSEYELNPETDLVPVCANCHAMIHRRNPPYTISEIRNLLN